MTNETVESEEAKSHVFMKRTARVLTPTKASVLPNCRTPMPAKSDNCYVVLGVTVSCNRVPAL